MNKTKTKKAGESKPGRLVSHWRRVLGILISPLMITVTLSCFLVDMHGGRRNQYEIGGYLCEWWLEWILNG